MNTDKIIDEGFLKTEFISSVLVLFLLISPVVIGMVLFFPDLFFELSISKILLLSFSIMIPHSFANLHFMDSNNNLSFRDLYINSILFSSIGLNLFIFIIFLLKDYTDIVTPMCAVIFVDFLYIFFGKKINKITKFLLRLNKK